MRITKNEIIPSLSGFQYGYNTSIIAGALLFIAAQFSLTRFQEGILVGVTMIGMCLASFSAILANYFGRKKVLFLSVLMFFGGCLGAALAPNFYLLLLGRLLVGFGAGIAIVAAPLYLVEIAPAESRGSVMNMNQVGLALGSLLAYLACYLLGFWGEWRVMFALGLIPALIQFVGLFFIPETLKKPQKEGSSWKNVLEPSFRSRFWIILGLICFQPLSGAGAIFFFAPRVFEKAGFADVSSFLLATVILGIVYLLAIFVSFVVVDRLGRRPLLIGSFLGMGVSLAVIAFFSYIGSPWLNQVTITFVLTYIAFYSIGAGPIPPMVIGEVSPLQVRGHVMTLMGFFGWLINYLIALTFLPLMHFLSLSGVFLIYTCFCFIGMIYFYRKLPETKQKSFQEIEAMFS
ncbi:MAG TPA: MFS transporter [Chlamydiales bacterium]|nr:MFS transporter [Chlamydiales bacterium]